MAKSGKEKVMAKSGKVENKGVEVIETSEKSNPNVMVKTTNMQISEKLQKAGIGVSSITGGIIGDPKTHYFRASKSECSGLVDNSELKLLIEVAEVTPSKKLYSGLKEAVTSGKPEKE